MTLLICTTLYLIIGFGQMNNYKKTTTTINVQTVMGYSRIKAECIWM